MVDLAVKTPTSHVAVELHGFSSQPQLPFPASCQYMHTLGGNSDAQVI